MLSQEREMLHWKVPTTIIGSLLVGLALALGHHFFYNSLVGQPVSDDGYDQLLNKGIGTAFAYLVRAALVICIGSTYWQIFWDALHRQTLKVSTVDSLAGVLGAVYEFLNFSIFAASPVLVALAIVSWLMPFVAILPPVTLTISPSIFTNQYSTFLQAPDFTHREAFAIIENKYLYNDSSASTSVSMSSKYSGPNPDLMRLTMASVYEGELPVFSSPAANSTYSHTWFGPTIQCQSISTSILSDFTSAMGGFDPTLPASMYTDLPASEYPGSGFYYLSWVPENATVPFGNDSIRTYVDGWEGVGPLPTKATLGAIDEGPAEIFVAARGDITTSDWTVINCSLHNASYTVDYAFTDRSQELKISSLHVLNPIAPNTEPDEPGSPLDNPYAISPESVSYLAIMDVLGTVLAGAVWFSQGLPNREPDGPNFGNSSGRVVVGSPDTVEIDRTRVLETTIAQTRELWPVYVNMTNGTDQGLSSVAPSTAMLLASALEGLFQNMTLALLARPRYLATQSTPTLITEQVPRNVYAYAVQRLWIAYGLALALTLLVVGLGSANLLKAGATYSNRFSTVLRTTRGAEIDTLIPTEYRGGEDPVPHAVRVAKLRLHASLDARTDERGEGGEQNLLEGKPGLVANAVPVKLPLL